MNETKLKEQFDKACQYFNLPGYSVTLYDNGEYKTLCGGYADVASGRETNGQTLYAIASCTKSFVAGTIAILIDQGLLALDGRVIDYVPEFRMKNESVSNQLTIRDMLCHRSGIQRHEFSWYPYLGDIDEKDIMEKFKYLDQNQPIRYKWQYSNQMFMLATYLISKVCEKPWKEVMKDLIFDPLEIKNVSFSPDDAEKIGDLATGYVPGEKGDIEIKAYADMSSVGGAGSLHMGSEDLAKWNVLLLNKGRYKDQQMISEAMINEMTRAQMLRDEPIPDVIKGIIGHQSYGLGLAIESFDGTEVVYHSGHIDGFMSYQAHVPDKGIAYSILTNLGLISVASIFNYIILEAAKGGDRDWGQLLYDFNQSQLNQKASDRQTLQDAKPQNAPFPIDLHEVDGLYEEPAYGQLRLKALDSKRLQMDIGHLTLFAEHYAYQYFYFDEPNLLPGMKFELCIHIDPKGKVTGVGAGFDFETTQNIEFKKIKNEKE